jgi:4-hydroxy-3-methylbut-2-en-1-yl diphosphate synthase IspG/GcpE
MTNLMLSPLPADASAQQIRERAMSLALLRDMSWNAGDISSKTVSNMTNLIRVAKIFEKAIRFGINEKALDGEDLIDLIDGAS